MQHSRPQSLLDILRQIALLVLCCSALTAAALGQGVPGLGRSKPSAELSPQGRWAVIIGVSEYQNLPQKSWLKSCHKDARAIADFLKSPRGGSVPDEHIRLLLNEDATARNIRLAFDFAITEAKAGDVVYLFYAGHGKVHPYGSGEAAYLMAYDSEPEYLNATAIPMDEVHRSVDLHMRQASQVIMITDACHAGAIVPTSLDLNRETRSLTDYLQMVGERNGVLNLMACRRDEVAFEDARLGGHGVLTYNILRALQGQGNATRDGIVRIQDVLEFVSYHVPRLTNQRQHPRYSSNYADEFPLANLELEGPDLKLPEPPGSRLEARLSGSVYGGRESSSSLKVVGAERAAELYLVKDGEQRTIGRVLSSGNALVTDNLQAGDYLLVQLSEAGEKTWEVSLGRGQTTFDVRTGQSSQ